LGKASGFDREYIIPGIAVLAKLWPCRIACARSRAEAWWCSVTATIAWTISGGTSLCGQHRWLGTFQIDIVHVGDGIGSKFGHSSDAMRTGEVTGLALIPEG